MWGTAQKPDVAREGFVTLLVATNLAGRRIPTKTRLVVVTHEPLSCLPRPHAIAPQRCRPRGCRVGRAVQPDQGRTRTRRRRGVTAAGPSAQPSSGSSRSSRQRVYRAGDCHSLRKAVAAGNTAASAAPWPRRPPGAPPRGPSLHRRLSPRRSRCAPRTPLRRRRRSRS